MKRGVMPTVERNLFLPALAGFFIAGIFLAAHVTQGLWQLWLVPALLLAAVALRMLRLPLRTLCLPAALLLALVWTQHWLYPAIPPEGKYDITATVYGDSKVNDTGNVTFTVTDVTLDGTAQPGKAYTVVYLDDDDTAAVLTDGMRIRFSGKVYLPYPRENEYDFDFPLWLHQHGMRYAINGSEEIEILAADTGWQNYAQRIAKLCHAKLQTVMGEQADLAVAMLLGYRSELAEDDTLAFQRAGVAHIMSVSGLHVGILSMALLWLLERMRLRKQRQIPIVAAFLLLYCGITGFAVASLRAAVTVLLWTVGKALGRKPNPLIVIPTAMLIVLILNPLQLFSAGFAMSFGAIGGIALLYSRFMQGFNRLFPPGKAEKKRKWKHFLQRFIVKVKQSAAICLSAQLGVLLPIAAYYHHIYFCGFFFNLLIVPIVSVLVPLYAVTTIVLWIPWIGRPLGTVLGAAGACGGRLVLWLVHGSNAVPWAMVRVAQPTVWVILAAYLGMLTVSHFVRAPLRRRLLAIGVLVAVAAVGSYAQRPALLRYDQLAVGSADSALIFDGDKTVGIDTGSTGGAMINRLLAEGRDLDALILTHLHGDHAGGVQAILDADIKIDQVYLPVDYEKQGYSEETLAVIGRLIDGGIPVTCLAAGDTLRFHETTIDVLWPQRNGTRGGDRRQRPLAGDADCAGRGADSQHGRQRQPV